MLKINSIFVYNLLYKGIKIPLLGNGLIPQAESYIRNLLETRRFVFFTKYGSVNALRR